MKTDKKKKQQIKLHDLTILGLHNFKAGFIKDFMENDEARWSMTYVNGSVVTAELFSEVARNADNYETPNKYVYKYDLFHPGPNPAYKWQHTFINKNREVYKPVPEKIYVGACYF